MPRTLTQYVVRDYHSGEESDLFSEKEDAVAKLHELANSSPLWGDPQVLKLTLTVEEDEVVH